MNLFDRGHDECIHSKYLLTCEQYEELLTRSGGFCELCGVPGVQQLWQKLCIDHDHDYGLWAVRGLLCHRCNRQLTRASDRTPSIDTYLANAWYLGLVDQLGITLGHQPEPPIGTRVTAPRGRNWLRTEEGWLRLDPRPHRRPVHMITYWYWLTYQFGAHNLRIRANEIPAAGGAA